MSVGAATTSQVAVLGPSGSVRATAAEPGLRRSPSRLIAFGVLALYGTVKWSELLSGGATARLLGLFGLAMLLACGRPALARRSRLLAAAATVLVLLAAFPLSGVPLAWIWHVRLALTARAIGNGLSGLPQVLVPYSGVNPWVTLVIVLGAAVLLFDGALLVAFAPGAMAELRRAGAALPLVALAAVPTTLIRPEFPYLDGAIVFALLVAFVWGERIGRRRVGGALGVCTLATIAAMFAAPALDTHKPWFNYRGLAGNINPTFVETFDWSQGYGPVDWPRKGKVVLQVQASQPEYWKAENLDAFNGFGWVAGPVQGGPAEAGVDPTLLPLWTQVIKVWVGDMTTSNVIGAGSTLAPDTLPQGADAGTSPGTWRTPAGSPLGPGDSYQVNVYAPHPGASALSAAGTNYSGLREYLTMMLPPSKGTPSPTSYFQAGQTSSGYQPVLVFPRFHSHAPIQVSGAPRSVGALSLLGASGQLDGYQLADVYRLAQKLAAGAKTPYRFVMAVQNYLDQRYSYNENPPRSSYPLESFLFITHRGYCQQFAGAMALLLRMGGVPARIAVGFTSGQLDATTQRWIVRDYDAHAWVEVWFPRYGWVRFDPTPAADPALSGHAPTSSGLTTNLAATGNGLSASKTIRARAADKRRGVSTQRRGASRRGAGLSAELPWLVPLVAVIVLTLGLLATKPLPSTDALVAELEAALRRIGRPLPAGATLTWLEHRVAGSADAAAYVRALRLVRFGGADGLPTRGQRRALRRQLRLGGGPFAALRGLWALPPRWAAHSTRSRRRNGA